MKLHQKLLSTEVKTAIFVIFAQTVFKENPSSPFSPLKKNTYLCTIFRSNPSPDRQHI